MQNSTAIQVDNISKCYHVYSNPKDRLKQAFWGKKKQFFKEFWALQDISFEVKQGEAVGIIGRNGSGKSTLLQLICKTLSPTNGHIAIKGRIAALLELGAGFNPEFTGRENVYMNGSILGFDRKTMDTRFDDIAAFADIGNFIDQPVKTYSTGMFVRLAFAVQVCVLPNILIIDEALAVGDVFFQQKCHKKLTELLNNGTTIVLVSHAMNQVEQFCQRALLLNEGKMVFFGKANEAVKHYYLVSQTKDLFLEKPPLKNVQCENLQIRLPSWPKENAFLDITQVPQVTNAWGQCLKVAICDQDSQPCFNFMQGEIASFYYEFELFQDIDVPLVGIVLQNQQGVIVHGKGSLEHGTNVPLMIKKGEHLFIKQDIKLDLAYGDYTFEVGLAALGLSDYQYRSKIQFDELYGKSIRICHLPNVGIFSISPRIAATPVQLLHHGIANLLGDCQVTKFISES